MTRGEANMVLGKAFRSCKKFITETPIHQLAIMVGIGAATVQSFGYYVRSKSSDNIAQKEYFLNAIKLTKNHPAAEYLIGKPIYYKGLDADFLLRQCYCNQYRQGVYNAYFNGSTRADLNKINIKTGPAKYKKYRGFISHKQDFTFILLNTNSRT